MTDDLGRAFWYWIIPVSLITIAFGSPLAGSIMVLAVALASDSEAMS